MFIARVHPVHAMNAEQVASDLWTMPTDLSQKPTCGWLKTPSTIAIYYYSAQKLILIVSSHGGYRLMGDQHTVHMQ